MSNRGIEPLQQYQPQWLTIITPGIFTDMSPDRRSQPILPPKMTILWFLRIELLSNLLYYYMNIQLCTYCKTEVNRRPDKRSKTGNVFCNQSCAASHNNVIHQKRITSKKCKCGKKISRETIMCMKCYQQKWQLNYKTLGESIKGRTDANRYCNIRKAARKKYTKYLPMQCLLCGYDVHVEICHKKDIADFSLDTLVSEINDFSNLGALCRNCHWEVDHGITKWAGQDSNL